MPTSSTWQAKANAKGEGAEYAFEAALVRTTIEYGIDFDLKPKNLVNIYGEKLSGKKHGIHPDAYLSNPTTGKGIFVEIKRQGKRGNAHERACKYFTPGIMKAMRKEAKNSAVSLSTGHVVSISSSPSLPSIRRATASSSPPAKKPSSSS